MIEESDFNAMTVDQLWKLYQDIRNVLTAKISEQKRDLDSRLESLGSNHIRPAVVAQAKTFKKPTATRRTYPKVLPIYRNPAEPSETWSGRGNRPRWLAAQLAAGKELDEFRIKPEISQGAARKTSARRKKSQRA